MGIFSSKESSSLISYITSDISIEYICNYIHNHQYHDDKFFTNLDTLITANEFDINTRNSEGKTLLHIHARKSNGQILEFLLNHGADPNIQDKYGKTPIFYCPESISCTKLLIDHGANLTIRDNDSHISLYYAAKTYSFKYVQPYLDSGMTVDIVWEFEPALLLHMAVLFRNIPLMKQLMKDNETVVNSTIVKWTFMPPITPLYIACENGFYEEFLCLIDHGAIVQDKSHNYLEVVLKHLESESSTFIFRDLIALGADINYRRNMGETLLHQCFHDSEFMPEIINMLVNNGLSVHLKSNEFPNITKDTVRHDKTSHLGGTPLHSMATLCFNTKIFETFFRHNANPNAPNQFHVTPFMILFHNSIFRFVSAMNNKNEDQETAFEIVKLFIDNGADLYIRDDFGCCALDYICNTYYSKQLKDRIIKYLYDQKGIHIIHPATNEVIYKTFTSESSLPAANTATKY